MIRKLSFCRCIVLGWRRYCLLIFLVLGIITMWLGYYGFREFYIQQNRFDPLDLLYLSMQLFSLESGFIDDKTLPLTLNIARFLAPSVTIYALVSAIAHIFRSEPYDFRRSLLRNYVVICGMGRKATVRANDFIDEGYNVVTIESGRSNTVKKTIARTSRI